MLIKKKLITQDSLGCKRKAQLERREALIYFETRKCKAGSCYSCLENLMGGGAWWAAVHGVAKSRTQLSVFTLTFHFHALEKDMAAHSSVLGLPSMGLHRVGND